jgi:hypothetical protein
MNKTAILLFAAILSARAAAAATTAPTITSGVVSAASYVAGAAPATWISIFGSAGRA